MMYMYAVSLCLIVRVGSVHGRIHSKSAAAASTKSSGSSSSSTSSSSSSRSLQMIEPKCCPAGFTGLRSMDNCKKWYGCDNGVVQDHVVGSCSNGLLFDEDLQYCEYDHLVTSCNTMKCGPPSPAPACQGNGPCCPPDHTGSLPIDKCSKFYKCVGGLLVADAAPCPSTTLFSVDQQRCDYGVTDCKRYVGGAVGFVPDTDGAGNGGSDDGGSSPATPTSSPVEEPASSDDENANGKNCPDGYTGLVPFQDCTKFYSCLDGSLESNAVNVCPPGTLFDQDAQACELRGDVVCKGAPTVSPVAAPTQSPVGPPTETPIDPNAGKCCPESFTGRRPFKGCTKFYRCLNGQLENHEENTCAPGTMFDELTEECEHSSQVTCADDPCDTSPPTIAPIGPPTTSPTSQPTTPPMRKCCPAGFTGHRPYMGCAKFYECVNGVVKNQATTTCAPGTLFDEVAEECQHSSQVTCADDPCGESASPDESPDDETPTSSPVATPTKSPIVTPTKSPVATPTESPVATPVATLKPTESPIATPTSSPVSTSTNSDEGSPTDDNNAPGTPVADDEDDDDDDDGSMCGAKHLCTPGRYSVYRDRLLFGCVERCVSDGVARWYTGRILFKYECGTCG